MERAAPGLRRFERRQAGRRAAPAARPHQLYPALELRKSSRSPMPAFSSSTSRRPNLQGRRERVQVACCRYWEQPVRGRAPGPLQDHGRCPAPLRVLAQRGVVCAVVADVQGDGQDIDAGAMLRQQLLPLQGWAGGRRHHRSGRGRVPLQHHAPSQPHHVHDAGSIQVCDGEVVASPRKLQGRLLADACAWCVCGGGVPRSIALHAPARITAGASSQAPHRWQHR